MMKPFTENMIAPCGLDCSLCRHAHDSEQPCGGCLGPQEQKYEYCRTKCDIMKCGKYQQYQYRFCDACPDYPCEAIWEKENRYQAQYVLKESPIQNLKEIREEGMEAFLEKQRQRFTCPACGDVICVHTGICRGCGTSLTAPAAPGAPDTTKPADLGTTPGTIITKAVIFDMDGVLSDSEWIYEKKILQVLAEEGISIKSEEINDLFGQNMLIICRELKARYGLQDKPENYAARIYALRDEHIEKNGLYPMPGAVEFVRKLHDAGIPLAVASSANAATIGANMERFGITDCFDYLVSGVDCAHGKPEPDIYLKAAELLGKDPADCIVFEDSANGVAAAKGAGMYCYAYVSPGAVPQNVSPADRIIHSFPTDLNF